MVDRLACAAIIACALGVFSPLTSQEAKTSTALTEQMRSLQDELAKAVSAREASERAAADLRNKLTAAAQVARDGAVALELERARTEVAEEKLRALGRQYPQDRFDNGGLSDARPAGDDEHLGHQGQTDRCLLALGKLQTAALLDPWQGLARIDPWPGEFTVDEPQ